MSAPSSPSKLRSIVTGCAPVSEAERDARWSKMAAQFPSSNVNNNNNKRGSPSSPGKENHGAGSPGVTVPASAFQQFKSPRSPVQDADGLASYPVRPLACTPPRHQHHSSQSGPSPHRSLYDGSPTKSRPKVNSAHATAAPNPPPAVLAPLSASSTAPSGSSPRHAHTRTKSMPPSSVSPQIASQPQPAAPAKAPQPATETRSVKVAREFEVLLASMDVPATIKAKMLSLDTDTKEGMLLKEPKGGNSSSSNGNHVRKPAKTRKQRSLSIPSKPSTSPTDMPDGFILVQPGPSSSNSGVNNPLNRSTNRPAMKSAASSSFSSSTSSVPTLSNGGVSTDKQPETWSMLLRTSNRNSLQPTSLVKLRILLRDESAAWINEWVRFGGFRGWLERVKELCEVEWREDCRDDALLYELLRCGKALLYSGAGRHALSTSGVEPFRALVDLLYSEKKPGDIPARQLIVEMVLGIFSIYPDSTPCPLPVDDASWGCPLAFNGLYVQQLEEPPYATEAASGSAKPMSHDLVKSLMQGPPDEKHVRQVTWLASTHRSRPYKRWVQELTGTISDFFWIFCHSQNLIPSFDLSKSAPGPQVPGGMTDGVEAIAMGCCAVHLRLLNELVFTAPSLAAAKQLHSDIFESGIERCLMTLRKCNKLYYPTIFYELSRYVHHAQQSGFILPTRMQRALEEPTPPTNNQLRRSLNQQRP